MKILLDLDGILANFAKGACEIHGYDWDEFMERHELGTWYLPKTLGVSLTEFWKPINAAGASFWKGLEPYYWTASLVGIVSSYDPEYKLCTTPSPCPLSQQGKLQWAANELGLGEDRVLFSIRKEEFANNQTLLIDDADYNVGPFVTCGGFGILFPSPFNQYKRFHGRPLEWIDSNLELLFGSV